MFNAYIAAPLEIYVPKENPFGVEVVPAFIVELHPGVKMIALVGDPRLHIPEDFGRDGGEIERMEHEIMVHGGFLMLAKYKKKEG